MQSDLLIRLVEAGVKDDVPTIKDVVEEMVKIARAKQHTILADRLENALEKGLASREDIVRVKVHG